MLKDTAYNQIGESNSLAHDREPEYTVHKIIQCKWKQSYANWPYSFNRLSAITNNIGPPMVTTTSMLVNINLQGVEYSTDTRNHNVVLSEIQHDIEYVKAGSSKHRGTTHLCQLSKLEESEIKCAAEYLAHDLAMMS